MKREVYAERFAIYFCQTSGMDEYRAYERMCEWLGRKKKPSRDQARVWLSRAMPHIRRMLEEEREAAGFSVQAFWQHVNALLSTSAASFLKQTPDGLTFDLYQPHITDAQRSAVKSVKLYRGTISQLTLQSPAPVLAQVARMMELERSGGLGGADGNTSTVADKIRQRFEASRLKPAAAPAIPPRPVLIQGKKA